MSELIDIRGNHGIIRRRLLTTASMLTLMAYVTSTNVAEAEDADRPMVWIELGGQLDYLNSPQQVFSPPFMGSIKQANLLSALNVQKSPPFAIDEDAKISFQPNASDWMFSATIQFGRSSASRHRHQQTANKTVPVNFSLPPPNSAFHFGPEYYYPDQHVKFADGQTSQSGTHSVLDFQVGKDVGLGLFGDHGSSVLSAGVRIAQFTSKSNISLHVEPDVQYPTAPISSVGEFIAWGQFHPRFHDYAGMLNNQRSFRGLGPSLAWNASAPFAGNTGHGELSLDWGMNGAVLFGRQRASGHYKTVIRSYYMSYGWNGGFQQGKLRPGAFQNGVNHTCPGGEQLATLGVAPNACHTNAPPGFTRERMVVVPNIGGSVGLSFRIEDFKVALGYRADFFFGAMDGGINTAKSENRGFYGPFANVSVGLGG
jgi:iron complex outermembrane receptor protein